MPLGRRAGAGAGKPWLRSSKCDLRGQERAALAIESGNRAKVGIGRRQREIAGRRIGGEHVHRVVFTRDGKIVGLGAIFGTEDEAA